MSEETWDDKTTTVNKVEEEKKTEKRLQGLGRGKPQPKSTNDEQPPAPTMNKWGGGGSSGFRSNNNNYDENSNPDGSGGFSSRNTSGFQSRGGGGGGGRGGFGGGNARFSSSNNDGNLRGCYNCGQTGHMSRECPEPRKENRRGGGGGGGGGFNSGNRGGGFGSGNNDRNINYGSGSNGAMSVTVRNDNNQNENGEKQSSFGHWRGAQSNDNNGDSFNNRSNFNNSAPRGGSGFRGSRGDGGGGFGSNDRNTNSSWSNNHRTDNQYRDNDGRKPNDGGGGGGGGNGFYSAGGRNERVSDDTSDQRDGGGPPRPERYIPPPPPTNEDDIFGVALDKGENFDKYHQAHVQCTPTNKVTPIDVYEEANLATQILTNIRRAHFEEPTPIQRYTIPCIRQQDDLVACAQTGSGKTAAFLLPIISNLLEYHTDDLPEKHHPPSPLCLILSPTRELALQTEREARKFSFNTPLTACSVIGGHDMYAVTDRLREGCHILSATTGRLKDMVEKGRVSLKKVKYFVLDEADRMLDTGFEPDIRKLEELGLPPKEERFTSMFSATFPEAVQKLAKAFLREDYVFLAVGTPGGANEDIAQTIEEVPQTEKKNRLFQLLEQNLKTERCLIFVETKRSADYIGSLLSQKKLMSTTMHGDRTQRQRYEAVQDFTNGTCPILVATSVAARGLDFPLIGYVVNFDLPDTSDFYIHRIGRTGRAGHLGKSISFFDPERESDRRIAPELIARLREAGQDVPEFLEKYTVTGFNRDAPSSRTTDIRNGANNFGNRNFQTSAPTGGSASAGGAQSENWD